MDIEVLQYFAGALSHIQTSLDSAAWGTVVNGVLLVGIWFSVLRATHGIKERLANLTASVDTLVDQNDDIMIADEIPRRNR